MNKKEEKQNYRTIGKNCEQIAVIQLEQRGYKILQRNYWCRFGEIDIIAEQKGCLVFVEVKYRSDSSKGTAAEAVTKAKQRKIKQAARYYLMEKQRKMQGPIRFDVVAMDGESFSLYQNAFDFFSFSF